MEARLLALDAKPEINLGIPTGTSGFIIGSKKSCTTNMAGNIPNAFRRIVTTIRNAGNHISFPDD